MAVVYRWLIISAECLEKLLGLSALHMRTYLIPIITLGDSIYYYHPHFANEEIQNWRD